MEDPEDSDDLDIVDSTRRYLGTDEYIAKVVESDPEKPLDAGQARNGQPRPRIQNAHAQGERMEWSDDGSEDTYAQLHNRKKGKRKKATTAKLKRGTSNKNQIVGKSPRKNGIMRDSAKAKDWEVDPEEELMETTLPDYLQQRKARFDRRMEKLRESGLRLPPSYDGIDFSDDERLEELVERPHFPLAKPLGAYKDVQLPKSLGLIPASIGKEFPNKSIPERPEKEAGVLSKLDHYLEQEMLTFNLFVYQTGGILGDDMGLGKTVQVISFLTAAFGKTGDERDAKRMRKMRRAGVPWYPRILIICPGTLIENWRAELQRWGWWQTDVFHADTKESAIRAATSGRIEIMFTTYTTYRMNKSEINMIEWDCVIADECHQIKGRRSETTQAMNEVNALCRIGLTGTAIQNSYDELWTLLNWTNPGKFGPIKTWKTSISEPLKMGQSHEATNHQLSKARKTAKALVENLLPQFFLRRMKSIIADQLPKKSDRVVFCPLTTTQSEAYENCLDSDVMRYIKTSADICSCGSGKKSGWCCNMLVPETGVRWQSYVFPSMQNLQKLSNHLAMLIPQSTDPRDRQDKDLETLQTAVPEQWQELYRNRDSILNYSNPEFCGKWKILKKLLTFWHSNGDKVLVFSHSVKLLKMLQMLFKHTAYNVSYLDGSMSYEDRARAVDDFNSDPSEFVFLISTRAGGVGLNITSANKVVVVDPNWNPAYDLQAQDRAYRIGQVRDVEVFRLVSAGTIEEIVYARQIYKQQQMNIGYTASHERRYFRGVQDQKEQKGEIFGLANLFAFQGDNIVLRDIVNKTNVAESKAGVAVVGLDVEDSQSQQTLNGHGHEDPLLFGAGEDENEAMSQVAAIIAGEESTRSRNKYKSKSSAAAAAPPSSSREDRPPQLPRAMKTDPVLAILAHAGVEYSHENSEVVGPSRIEAGLSRRALENGTDLQLGDQHVFQFSQSQSQRQNPTSKPFTAGGGGGGIDDDVEVQTFDADGDDYDYDDDLDAAEADYKRRKMKWKYHPPPDVRKRQLCSMAKAYGMGEDVVGFALVVEGWTQEQRRVWLEKFYRLRRRETEKGKGKGKREGT